MFNVLIFGLVAYYFYKNNIKTGRLKQFVRKSLPDLISYLERIANNIDGNKHKNNTGKSNNANYMSIEEAKQILGVKNSASKEEILSSFKKLMLVNHPDKGGSSYLAAKIIQAKKTLLNE